MNSMPQWYSRVKGVSSTEAAVLNHGALWPRGGIMCQSTAFLKKGDKEELILEDVAYIKPEIDKLVLIGLLGDRKELKARLVEIDLMAHKVVLEEIG